MNFDELYEYCQELNKSNAEKCLVCHIPVENTDKHIKLKCSHIFHPTCIKYKDGSIKCLYCEETSFPEKINWNLNTLCCKIVLKFGLRKGQFCNRTNCLYHKLNSSVIQVIDPNKQKKSKNNKNIINNVITCEQIINTGLCTGKVCGRNLPCKYHSDSKKKLNIEV